MKDLLAELDSYIGLQTVKEEVHNLINMASVYQLRRQHGLPQMKLSDLAADMPLLHEAQAAAEELLSRDPELSEPENRPVLARVRRLFDDTGNRLN